MQIIVKYLFILLSAVLLSSCNKDKKVDIVVSDIDYIFNASMYRGVKPDIKFSELCKIVGEPNEYLNKGSGDDEEHSPIYYFKEGKLICHWSGSKKADIGCIDYIPYENRPLYIQDILKVPITDYNITPRTKRIRLYEGDMLYYIIRLKDYRVTEIEYWLVKKKFFNVAS